MPRRKIPPQVAERVREAAGHRCGYCLSPQRLVMARLEIEHITPLGKGGTDEESNLWLACPLCNGHKSDKVNAVDPETETVVRLFNPRTQKWFDHFRWSADGLRVVGLTAVGRATVIALHLSDDPRALMVRRHWLVAGWHPPTA
jgi:HNH endonuclease